MVRSVPKKMRNPSQSVSHPLKNNSTKFKTELRKLAAINLFRFLISALRCFTRLLLHTFHPIGRDRQVLGFRVWVAKVSKWKKSPKVSTTSIWAPIPTRRTGFKSPVPKSPCFSMLISPRFLLFFFFLLSSLSLPVLFFFSLFLNFSSCSVKIRCWIWITPVKFWWVFVLFPIWVYIFS